jgi:hypothetical protein
MPTDNPDKLTLYHFTSIGTLKAIRLEGLSRGRVELSDDPQDYVHAISLTTSGVHRGHGVDAGSDLLTDEDRVRYQERTGKLSPKGARFADFTAVRIMIELERSDPLLVQWHEFRKRIQPSRRKELELDCRVSTWWVYLGVIPPEKFSVMLYRHGTEYRDQPA